MMGEKIGHRPYGTGATTITIRRRTDNPGYVLFIGRKLWQDIGMPERVILSGAEGKYLIEATTDQQNGYRVSGYNNNTMPRCSVGKSIILSLGLSAKTYEAESYPLRHLILFWDKGENDD